jgi:molybdate transport system substrate-binding protein
MRHWPIVAALGLTLACETAQAGEVKLLASGALREALEELLPEFERAGAHKVALTIAGTAGIVNRMQKGEVTDVVILADYALAGLTREGKVVDGSRADFARAGVGVAVAKGAPRPDIGSAEALRRTLLAARSIAHSRGPSGIYLAGLFRKLGIADELKAKVKEVEGEPVARLVARGEIQIGFQQISEIIHVAGVDYIGPLPPDVQHITVFASGLASTAKETDAAKALVRFLTGPAAGSVLKKHGLEPG